MSSEQQTDEYRSERKKPIEPIDRLDRIRWILLARTECSAPNPSHGQSHSTD